jgi:isoleucyl-tRNA synthetase
VLTTLTKLFAPVIPFLSEAMWQNLRTEKDPESVHLYDFPEADAKLVDEELSKDMDALLTLVSLGGAARNVAKINLRQPLAELRVQPADEAVRRAVERFPEQLREELNVKRVSLHAGGRPLLVATAKLNKKTAAAKLGPKLKDAEAYLTQTDALKLAERFRSGPVDILGVPLESADLTIEYAAEAGWAGVADRGTQVAIDTRVTEALALEGLARSIIRQIQEHRKNSGLNMEDRIVLHLGTYSDKLKAAINAHRDHIAAETLVAQWSDAPMGEAVEVKIEGQVQRIALRKSS